MRKSKQYRAILSLCAYLFAFDAVALGIPTFDIIEDVPMVFKDLKTDIDTLKDLKKQIDEMKKTLNAIGSEIGSIAGFLQGFVQDLNDMVDTFNNVISVGENLTNTIGQATSSVSNAIQNTVNNQQGITGDYVNQTQQTIGIGNHPSGNSKDRPGSRSVLIEEEEEEEIDISEQEKEIFLLQKETADEQKQLAIELNDILDNQLTMLNEAVAKNTASLLKLQTSIETAEEITKQDKEKIKEEISEILEKYKDVGNWAANIIEQAKENYNKEYNAKIKDGINNYTKIVIEYIKGDSSQDAVIIAGEKLKNDVNAINVTPDSSVLKEVNATVASLQKDTENLIKKITEIVDAIQKETKS